MPDHTKRRDKILLGFFPCFPALFVSRCNLGTARAYRVSGSVTMGERGRTLTNVVHAARFVEAGQAYGVWDHGFTKQSRHITCIRREVRADRNGQ
jgi:hypothetical protein